MDLWSSCVRIGRGSDEQGVPRPATTGAAAPRRPSGLPAGRSMPSQPTNFGLLEGPFCDYERSRAVVLPVPFERTTTYGKGTAHGPAAIVRASQAMELHDEELGSEPFRQGIATLPP